MRADDIAAQIRAWGLLWGVPGLHDLVTVRFSRRLRASLGRCRLSEGTVVLRSDLAEAGEQLASVLCHEVAHVAANTLAPGQPPHGRCWQELVRAAGFPPEVRARAVVQTETPAVRPARLRYEHRCPVCQFVRFARRPMTSWRCPECTDVGLSGALIITRLD